MADSTFLSLIAVALIAVIAGLVIQSFIIFINVSDWSRGRSVTPVDHIITSLGFSRICLSCALTLFLYLYGLKSLYSYVSLVITDAVYSFFIYLDIWLSSLLSVVFFLKIANLHTRLFLYLRRLIVHRTVYFTVASVLLSSFNCLFPFLTYITEAIKGGIYNTTIDNVLMDCSHIQIIFNIIIGAFIPVLFNCISSVLLFASLYHHTTNMKMSGNLTINLEPYYSAIKLISFTFTYNTIYLFGHSVCMLYFYFYCVDFVWLYFALGFLPVIHSSFLIYRTAKLRNQMPKVLQSVTDFLFQCKDTETKEDMEVVA